MKTTTTAALLLVFFLALPVPAQVNDPAATAKSREGVWKPVAAEKSGVKMPPVALGAITLTLTRDNYEVAVKGESEPDRGTSSLDTSVTPHRMTITSTSGPNKGKTFLAIDEMKDADSLRVCYDLSGQEFPKEFKVPKSTHLYLVGYRRQSGSATFARKSSRSIMQPDAATKSSPTRRNPR